MFISKIINTQTLHQHHGISRHVQKKPKIELQIDVLYDWLDNYVQRQDITTQIAIIKREVKAKYVKLEEFLQELEKISKKIDDLDLKDAKRKHHKNRYLEMRSYNNKRRTK